MAPYIVGYFINLGKPANMSQFYLVLPLIVLMSTLIFPIGMALSRRIGSTFIIFIGGVFAVGFTFLSVFVTQILAFFALYAVGFGVGKGFLYPAPLLAGWSHLPGRKGFVSGVVISGLGIGAFVFGMIATQIVNPGNISPVPYEVAPGVFEFIFPEEVNIRVPVMILTFCAIWTVMISIGLLTISNFKDSLVSQE
jgi:MFS family permease